MENLKYLTIKEKKELLENLTHDLNTSCYVQGKLTELVNKIHDLKADINKEKLKK